MIRIRPGRSWRHNPRYVEELQALTAPRARRFEAGSLLDVVGIEVDGVDIAAGVGEAQVVVAVEELAQALLQLAAGAAAAQATVGPGPTEALLEARGPDVALSLVRLATPARLLASGLLVDRAKLRTATLAAARTLVADLLGVSPALERAPAVQRLAQACSALAGREAPGEAPPPLESPRAPAGGLVVQGRAPSVACEVHLPGESAARLALAGTAFSRAPLAALIGRGTLVLRAAAAPAIEWEAVPFLALRDVVHAAEALLQAWEAGEPRAQLAFGPAALDLDLASGLLLAPGWAQPAAVAPAALAAALSEAARRFALRALRLCKASGAGGECAALLRDLEARARAALEHARDVASGDLRRAPEAVSAPPPRQAARPPPPPPLAAGRLRKLVHQPLWRATGADPAARIFFSGERPGALVVVSADEARAHELATGAVPWRLPVVAGAAAIAADGADLYLLDPDRALARVEGASGAPRWRRRLPELSAPRPRLWPLPGGVLCASGPVLHWLSDVGPRGWRLRLDSAPTRTAFGDGILLVTTTRGTLGAVDAADGRLLWRATLGGALSAPVVAGGRALCAFGDPARPHVACLTLATGARRWERAAPPAAQPGTTPAIALAGETLALVCGERPWLVRAADGEELARPDLALGGPLALSLDEDPDRPALVFVGAGGAAARVEPGGAIAWRAAPELPPDSPPPAPPRLAALITRGVALVAGAGALRALDLVSGLGLEKLAGEPAALAASGALDLAVLGGDGSLALHRVSLALGLL